MAVNGEFVCTNQQVSGHMHTEMGTKGKKDQDVHMRTIDKSCTKMAEDVVTAAAVLCSTCPNRKI